MIAEQLAPRGIRDERVLAAMAAVPRERFVPPEWRHQAYDDSPLPIGDEQTISQPFIVALMLEWARLAPGDRVLELGCGSGYVLALLDHMGMDAWGIEIVQNLAAQAAANLAAAGFAGPLLRAGDGWAGWPEAAPFAAILISAATPLVPPPLTEQLAEGGRLILPLGRHSQELICVHREGKRLRRERILAVRFVPLRGEVEQAARDGDDPQAGNAESGDYPDRIT